MKTIEVEGSTNIDWMYPEIHGNTKPKDTLVIALYHMRAASDIHIQYDSDKDGWEISRVLDSGERRQLAFIPAREPDTGHGEL